MKEKSSSPYQGVQNFAVYFAAKAYVLRLAEALYRELKRDGIIVTALCPSMWDTGFAAAAQQKITPALKLLLMQSAPVVCARIRALQAGRQAGEAGLGALSLIFDLLPHIPLQLIFYDRDDEFPARANLLYDLNATQLIDLEVLAVLVTVFVQSLTKLKRDVGNNRIT